MKQTEITYPTPSQPRQIRLDSIARCNASCLSCHRFLNKRSGEMSAELITQILDDVSRWETPLEEIIPVNYGEFFLRKDWPWILATIANKLPKTAIVIPTNGSLLDETAVKIVCQIPTVRIINFSVNAYFEDTYQAFTGLPPENIQQIRKAVCLLRILRPDIGVRVSYVFDPIFATDLERDLFKNYWVGFAEVWIIPAASADRPDKQVAMPVKIPCRSIFSDFVIGFDGKLSSCCFDSGFTLDLSEYSRDAKQDWHNAKITKLRELHNQHKRETIPICSRCTFG